MEFIETQVRRVLGIQAKYKQDYVKRDEDFLLALYGLNPDFPDRYVLISYGSVDVFYPYAEDPKSKFNELEVVYDELVISHWSPNNSVTLQLKEFGQEEYWNIVDVEHAVQMFSDFLTDYIELAFQEKATEEAWSVDD